MHPKQSKRAQTKELTSHPTPDQTNSQAATESSPATGSQDSDTEQGEDRLPYIFARKTVKSDRKITQYFLRDEAQAVEKDVQRAIEKELGTDVSLIDVREALVLVGAEHLDEVADELRDWGYRFKED